MNIKLATTIFIGTLFVGSISLAQESDNVSNETADAMKVESVETPKKEVKTTKLRDPDKVICKKSGKTSTRLRRKKICKTRAQWDLERSNNRDAINEVKSQTSVGQHQ